MNKEKRNNKINRIEKCLGELLSRELSLKFKSSLFIPLDVFRNFVRNNAIDTADKLLEELLKFSRGNYETVHPYPPGVITRDYVLPVIKRINDENSKEDSSCSLSFPCIVESCYSDTSHKELSGYCFHANREYYAAKRIDKYMQNYYKYYHLKNLFLTLDAFSKFLQSPKQNLEYIIQEQSSAYKNLISTKEQVAFTVSHVIPVLNYLNEIANENSYRIRYHMRVCCKKQNEQVITKTGKIEKEPKEDITYEITIEEIPTAETSVDTDYSNPYIVSEDAYFSLNSISDIVYYQMSKWAYLIHVYILNSFHNSRVLHSVTTLKDKQNEYFLVELNANAVWTFWYNSPLTSNSYHSEFAKAIDELKNIVPFCVPSNSADIRSSWILPNPSGDDEKYNIARQKIPKELYRIYSFPEGKYYVYLKNRRAQMLSLTTENTKYPKELIRLSTRTSYSQIRLFEFLYDLFVQMKKSNNKTADISIPRLAVITGKIDIADWKVNQHFKDIDPTNSNYINQIYHKVIRTGRFAFDLKRFFLQPNLKLFNEYLKANHGEYTYEYNDDNSTNPQIPSIQFTLVPLSETNQ